MATFRIKWNQEEKTICVSNNCTRAEFQKLVEREFHLSTCKIVGLQARCTNPVFMSDFSLKPNQKLMVVGQANAYDITKEQRLIASESELTEQEQNYASILQQQEQELANGWQDSGPPHFSKLIPLEKDQVQTVRRFCFQGELSFLQKTRLVTCSFLTEYIQEFCEAAICGDRLAVLEWLILYPNIKIDNLVHMCETASLFGRHAILTFLLGLPPSVDSVMAPYGHHRYDTYLQNAMENGHLRVAKWLYYKYTINLSQTRLDSIMAQIIPLPFEFVRTVRWMLQAFPSNWNSSFFHTCIKNKKLGLLKLFYTKYKQHYPQEIGSILNQGVFTCCQTPGSLGCFQFLLEQKADPLVETSNGSSCLHDAIEWNWELEGVQILIEAMEQKISLAVGEERNPAQALLQYFPACKNKEEIESIQKVRFTIFQNTLMDFGATEVLVYLLLSGFLAEAFYAHFTDRQLSDLQEAIGKVERMESFIHNWTINQAHWLCLPAEILSVISDYCFGLSGRKASKMQNCRQKLLLAAQEKSRQCGNG